MTTTTVQPGEAPSSGAAPLPGVDSRRSRLLNLLLKPAMRIALAHYTAQLSSAPQPTDAPQGHGRGLDPDRILLFSSTEVTGTGVVSHRLALAGQLADEVSQATRRGTDVDLSVHRSGTIRSAADAIRGSELERYDAVVVSLGTMDAFTLTAPARWSSGLEALLKEIRNRSITDTPILVTAIHPIPPTAGLISGLWNVAREHAMRLNHATAQVCGRWSNATFVPLPSATAKDTRQAATALYTEWARHLARHLAHRLPVPGSASGTLTARSVRSRPQPRERQRRALLDLGITMAGPDERFDRVVRLARSYFQAQHAALVLSDGDKVRFMSRAGFRGSPDLTQLASATISSGRPVLAGDVRSADNAPLSLHVGGRQMGFYAGYPIEAPDGTRIGVLCILDQDPRITRATDTVMLRDLAMLLQREFWTTSGREDTHA